MEKEKRSKLFNYFKILISLGLILFLVLRTDMVMVKEVLFSVHGGFLMLAVLCLVAELILMTFRLQALLLMKNIRLPFFVILKLNLISAFVGTFLPTRLGMDALRVFFLSKHTKHVVDSISSVAVDRFLNMFIITCFAIINYFIGGYHHTMPNLILATLPMVLGVGLVLLFLSKRVRSSLGSFLNRIRVSRKITSWLGDLAHSFFGWRGRPKLLLKLILLAIFFQCVRISTSYVFARSLWIEVPYSYFFIVIPIVTVLGMLPFSIAGIGIAQVGSIYFLELIGVDSASAFGMAVLIYFVRILVMLPGLYFFYREGLDSLVESGSRLKFFRNFRRKEAV